MEVIMDNKLFLGMHNQQQKQFDHKIFDLLQTTRNKDGNASLRIRVMECFVLGDLEYKKYIFKKIFDFSFPCTI